MTNPHPNSREKKSWPVCPECQFEINPDRPYHQPQCSRREAAPTPQKSGEWEELTDSITGKKSLALLFSNKCECQYLEPYGFVAEAGCEQHDTYAFQDFIEAIRRKERASIAAKVRENMGKPDRPDFHLSGRPTPKQAYIAGYDDACSDILSAIKEE